MRNKKWLLPVMIAIPLVVLTVLLYTATNKSSMSDAQVRERFECNRVTQEIRKTDVFCARPELYRNPNISEIDYTAWQYAGCSERLKNVLTEEQRQNNPGMAKAYDDCINKPSLHAEYLEFIRTTTELRANN